MLFQPSAEVSFSGAKSAGNIFLRGALGQKSLDLRSMLVQLAFTHSFGSSQLHPGVFLCRQGLLVRLLIRSRSISAAIAKAIATILD